MGLWTAALIAIGGLCLASGALHLFVGVRRPVRADHLWFGIVTLTVSLYSFLTPLTYHAPSTDLFARGLRWQMALGALTSIALAWFVVAYSGLKRRWLAWVLTVIGGAWFVADLLSRSSILYRSIDRLDRVTMPWGEQLALAVGPPNPWRLLTDAGALGFAVLLVTALLSLVRAGKRSRAVLLGATFGLHIVVTGVLSPLIDLGVFRLPYLGAVTFLGAVVVMGAGLARAVVRETHLAEAVVESERRFRTLLDDVDLFVIAVDRNGILAWANRYAIEASAYAPEEAIGYPLDKYTAPRDRAAVQASFERALAGEPMHLVESAFLTRSGQERLVSWSTVVLRDPEGEFEMAFAIGADVTERRDAERARDQLIRELETLKQQLEEENLYLRGQVESARHFGGIIGTSGVLRDVLAKVEKVAPTDTTVLVMGETGTGKELIARAVHEASTRAGRPFVTVNCGALPATLIESELFGHERGAFTGATTLRKGRFELADGGTLFLDEIGELPLELQPKLLRVLQFGEVERIGASRQLRVDVRVIAATHRDLESDVAAGRFRRDLFFRLHVFPLIVPPLRERTEDIPLLVEHFVPVLAARAGRTIEEVPGTLLHELRRYAWPGNVRELIAVLERAVVAGTGPVLRLADRLRPAAQATGDPRGSGPIPHGPPLVSLEEVDRAHISRVLEATGGRIEGDGGAAEILGLKPSTLRSRMKKLHITT